MKKKKIHSGRFNYNFNESGEHKLGDLVHAALYTAALDKVYDPAISSYLRKMVHKSRKHYVWRIRQKQFKHKRSERLWSKLNDYSFFEQHIRPTLNLTEDIQFDMTFKQQPLEIIILPDTNISKTHDLEFPNVFDFLNPMIWKYMEYGLTDLKNQNISNQ
jgi:hypothetical protein